jgi:hypothetical protein
MSPDAKVNVLLVDDYPENLLALEAILEGLGQNLVKANSGEEALRCLLDQDFAVILLDVQMPGIDGFETATLIRERARSQHTPIIFMTAFSSSDSLVFKGYSLGAVDYLLKPIKPEILTSKVAVFVDLFKKSAEVKRQANQLTAINSELRQSEERFRSLSACSPVGIFLTDMAGQCTYTNPRYQTICEVSAEASLGAGWLQCVCAEDRDRAIQDWLRYTQEGKEYSDEFRLKTSDGTVRWMHVRSSPMVSGQGELLGHVGTLEDITERKQAEDARSQFLHEQIARQEAEAANRIKDEFLAILSHELRTPLNSILGWARLLRTRTFDESTTSKALETIERNAKAQSQLIEDILDVSRIIRGKLRLMIRPVSLASVIETAIEAVRPLADGKSIQMETHFPETTQLIAGDPDRLQQVIWNLLSNAIKFTPANGKVSIFLSFHLEAADHCTEPQPLDRYAQIQVIDTGIGISSDFLPYVFDRFRQADSTTTRPYGGLGLGLAIVRHLIELHGGTVTAASSPVGQGAMFTVQLPLSHKPVEPIRDSDDTYSLSHAASVANPPSLQGVRVLIVDDDADTREFFLTALEQYGAEVTIVGSVNETLATLPQLQPQVLISDIGMPEADGYELIRQVRSLPPHQGCHTPAIALTAYTRLEDRKRALESGFQMHLAKPIEPGELIVAVAKLAGKALESSAIESG